MNTLKKLALLALSLPLAVFGYAGTWTQDGVTLSYTMSGTDEVSVLITSCGDSAEVKIPSEIDGYKVTSIGATSFDCREKIASVVIPDSVTSIGEYAFSGCSSLTSVTIPNSVTNIDKYAFSSCSGLESVTIPESVTSIGAGAFGGCSSLTSVTIPNSVTSIGDYTFFFCSSLTSVTIPSGVTSIGEYAFSGCSSLTSVTIPDGVTSIGDWSFSGCSSLTSVSIPKSVTGIGDYAFSGCSKLTSATIPECVFGYLSDTFYDSTNLQHVEIADGVESIKANAFKGCSGLTSVTIPSSVLNIGDGAFSGCGGITSVTIPPCVFGKLSTTFPDSTGLQQVEIADGVASIDAYAFRDCTNLKSVTIPDSVTSIGYGAFYDCSDLTSVTIPSGVTSLGDHAFQGCSSLTSVTIPNSVTSIGDEAFRGCSGLKSVTISDSVTSIRYSAFRGCSSLTSVTIPNKVTSIGLDAFAICRGLTSVMIPNSVTSISEGAFDSTALATVFVDFGDTDRVKGLLEASGVEVGDLTFVEVGLTALAVTPIAPFGVAIDYTHTMMPGETATYTPVITATATVEGGETVYTAETLTEALSLGENKYRVYWNMAKDGVPSLANATIAVTMREKLTDGSTATPKESNTKKVKNVTASVIVDGDTVTDTITLEAVPSSFGAAVRVDDELFLEAQDETKSATYRPTENGAHTIEHFVGTTVMSVTYNFNLPPLTVSGVSVQTIKPFGLAIDYTVGNVMAGAEGYVPEVTLTLADGITKYTATTLSEPQSLGENKYRLYWNLAKDGIASFEGATVSVTYKDPLGEAVVANDGAKYCVIDLSAGSNAKSYPLTFLDEEPEGGFAADEAYKQTKFVLKRVEAGSFIMGEDQENADHKVTLTKPFYMALFETTQKQWELVMGENPSWFQPGRSDEISEDSSQRPVEQVSYNMIRGSDAGAKWPADNNVDDESFLGKLRARTGLNFDLPTEAQWEYACRAGTKTKYNLGDNEADLAKAGWYKANSTNTTHDVGGKMPNGWGLYDMHGNVREWCLNWYGADLTYGSDPTGKISGEYRVIRRGAFSDTANICTSYSWTGGDSGNRFYDIGFRLSRTLSTTPVTPATFSGVSATVLTNGSKVSEEVKIDCAPFEGADVTVMVNDDEVDTSSGSYAWLPSKVGENKIVYTIDGNTFIVSYDAVERAPVITDVQVQKVAPFGVAIDYTYTLMENATTVYSPVITATTVDEAGTTVYTAQTLSTPQSLSESENKYRVYWNMAKDGVPSLAGATVAVTLKEKLPDYCVVDLPSLPDDAAAVAALTYGITWTDDVPEGGYNKDDYKTAKLVLKRIDAGSFIMGSDQDKDEHKVTLTKPFYMALFETTQEQWKRVTGTNPSEFQTAGEDTPKRPVESVSYNMIRGASEGAKWPASNAVDSDSFLGLLRARTGNLAFDLPTEAQWEYACRAGTTNKWSFGKDDSIASDYMWSIANSGEDGVYTTHEVGGKSSNPWGLYDMHGNVEEWCLDRSGDLSYGFDPKGADTDALRVMRGGCFVATLDWCSSSFRDRFTPSLFYYHTGFRLALPVEQKSSETYEVSGVTTSVIADGDTVTEAIDFDYLGTEDSPVSIFQTAEGGAGDKTEIVGDKTSVGSQSWQPTKPDDFKYEYFVDSESVLSATYKMWDIPMSFSDETLKSFNYEGVYDGAEHGIALTNGCDALKGIAGATVAYTTSPEVAYPTSPEDAAADLYEDSYPTIKDAGTKTVYFRIVADGYATYRGSATVEIKPRPVTLKSGTKTDFVYDGRAHEFSVLIKSENSDGWFVAGEGIATSNWATVTNVSDGEDGVVENTFTYTFNEGTLETNYTITPQYGKISVQPLDISGEGDWVYQLNEDHIYDGNEWTQEVVSAKFKGLDVSFDLTDNKQTNAGTYQMTLTGKGNFTGSRKIAWSIGRRKLELTAANGEKVYDGTPLKADYVRSHGFVLGEGAGYVLNSSRTGYGESENTIDTIRWNDNTLESNYEVTKKSGKLTIKKRPVTITSESNTNLVYNGKDQTYEVITIGGQGFVAGEGIATSNWAKVVTVRQGEVENKFDYAFDDPESAENYAVTVNYGTIKVVPKELTASMFSFIGIPEGGYVWDGNAKTPELSCQDGTPSIIAPDDYLSPVYTDNVEVGQATVTITGQNNYTGTVVLHFSIGELYADVTFDALGGKIDAAGVVTQTQTRVYSDLPADPTRANYTFEGWYLDVADETTKAAENGEWLADGDHTLYAKWAVDSAVLPDAADGVLAYSVNDDGSTVTITGLGTVAMSGTSLVIPDMIDGKYVTEIADNAFKSATGITSVTLPMFLERIGFRAFYNVRTLATLNIPSVRDWRNPSAAGSLSIGKYAFSSAALTEVRLPAEVAAIENYAFLNCRSLERVTILGSPTLGERPFRRTQYETAAAMTVRLSPALANDADYLAALTAEAGVAAVRTDAVVESVSIGALSVAPETVRLSVAVGRAADWGAVDASRVSVEYRESLGDAPTTLTPGAVTQQADGTLAVEVAAPKGASGFFRVKVAE